MNYYFMNIEDNQDYQNAAAEILSSTFNNLGNTSWPTFESAISEVKECIEKPNICIGIMFNDILVGWVGLRPMYKNTWELHPLVIKTDYQGKGIGKLLLSEIEKVAKKQGIIGIALGTDDEYNKTSLSSIKITKDNIFESIHNIKNVNHHPYEFYQKNGYFIVGIIPNANGKNKPDIWMWKSLIEE